MRRRISAKAKRLVREAKAWFKKHEPVIVRKVLPKNVGEASRRLREQAEIWTSSAFRFGRRTVRFSIAVPKKLAKKAKKVLRGLR